MKNVKELTPRQLRRRCDPKQFRFRTVAELEDLSEVLGQSRAVAAIRFGIGIGREGYNLFAMGPTGAGRHTIVRRFLDQRAAAEETPPDWCYVHHFGQGHKPHALRFPPGRARVFSSEMERLVEDLRSAIPAAFETDAYRARRQEIDEEFSERQGKVIEDIRQRAAKQEIALVHTPGGGLAFTPMRQGEAVDTEAFEKLPEEERNRIVAAISGFQQELEKFVSQQPKLRREKQSRIRELNRSVTGSTVNGLIEDLKKEYEALPEVKKYLTDVQNDIVGNAENFRRPKEGEAATLFGMPLSQGEAAENALRRYRVNVLIDHAASKGAPVVFEDNPTYNNLVGRVEYLQQMGVLVTDFTLIKPGALHRANGGYLVIEALKLLRQPFAWEGLKRALRSREISTESPGQMLSLISTVSLEPEPIKLDVKVVLIGERLLYYLLHHYDPEFGELFKVMADFEETMEAGSETHLLYARLIGTIARREGLRPLDRGGVARVIEQGSRMAGDAEKLSIEMQSLGDLLRESDYWAGEAKQKVIRARDVEQAIAMQHERAGRLRERLQEETRRGTLLIDTSGERIGQVNGLSVLQLGNFSFGHPSRITARVRLGGGRLVDIEREVEMGGPIHSKGVLILSGFLAGRYAPDAPLSLSASLVFEQSYAGVDGDSASSAELYALLSALAGAPVQQGIAVTGSVNQHGGVQAIGGVNEKIEGFFDLCKARGLTGRQGVVIPRANVKHLMLRPDVVRAAAAGRFHVYPVETIDQGIRILTGLPAGKRDRKGNFPEGSLNQRVEQRLVQFARQARSFRGAAGAEEERKP
jgi:predicted ATP-dependent protease